MLYFSQEICTFAPNNLEKDWKDKNGKNYRFS
jgi:hypothetical protein